MTDSISIHRNSKSTSPFHQAFSTTLYHLNEEPQHINTGQNLPLWCLSALNTDQQNFKHL